MRERERERERERDRDVLALLCLYSWCFVISIVMWLSLVVSWVGLQCRFLVFHDHANSLAFLLIKTHNVKKDQMCKSPRKNVFLSLDFNLINAHSSNTTFISMASHLDLQCISKNHLQVISQ